MKPQKYGPFAYSPIVARPKLVWPDGARVALWVIPNIEFFSLDESVPAGSGGSANKPPDVMQWAQRDYGNRVGVFRLMDVFDRYGIRATVALNSDLCAQHPFIIDEGRKRNWEWMGHNQTNTRRLSDAPAGGEAAIVRATLDTIEAATGARPRGWLSSGLQETWDTLDLLEANGCTYVADWVNDDQPYAMQLEGGRSILSVPYSGEINDKPAYEKFHRTSAEFGDMIRRQFDELYREGGESGRVMAIALHPYLSGVPHRIAALDAALEYICSHEHVWRATGSEIAAAYANTR
jgi:allantoinase